jgi:hypothetical protein
MQFGNLQATDSYLAARLFPKWQTPQFFEVKGFANPA